MLQEVVQIPGVAQRAVEDKQRLVREAVLRTVPLHSWAEVREPLLEEARGRPGLLVRGQSTSRLGLEKPWSARAFSKGYTGFSLKSPAAMPLSSRVRRSRASLNPGADLPSVGRNVLAGSGFQKSPVSSTLNACRAVQLPSRMPPRSSAGHLRAASALAPGAAPRAPRLHRLWRALNGRTARDWPRRSHTWRPCPAPA